ncbi:MAG: ArnT family glycosyltransferase, partial [Planctomycetia bacterium]
MNTGTDISSDPDVESRNATWAALLLLAAACLVYGWGLNDRGLWSAHEGRAAQNAQTMLDQKSWLVPKLFIEEPDVQKPPMYYWLTALTAAVDGGTVKPWSVRFPATAAAVLGLLVVYRLGRRMFGPSAGLCALVILAATTRYAWLARVGRIDMPLMLVCTAAVAWFWLDLVADRPKPLDGFDESPRRLRWSFFLVAALGVMLKGPVAVVLVMLPALTYFSASGRPWIPFVQTGWRETWRECRVLPGLGLTAALSAPWFVYIGFVTNGQYLSDFFLYHNVARAVGGSEGLKGAPFWFYVPRLFIDAFPWTLLLPAALAAVWRQRDRLRSPDDPWRRTNLFLLCWIGSQFVFFSAVHFK